MYSNCCVICLIELKCICVFLNLIKSKITDLHVNNEREREKKKLLENTLFYGKNGGKRSLRCHISILWALELK